MLVVLVKIAEGVFALLAVSYISHVYLQRNNIIVLVSNSKILMDENVRGNIRMKTPFIDKQYAPAVSVGFKRKLCA